MTREPRRRDDRRRRRCAVGRRRHHERGDRRAPRRAPGRLPADPDRVRLAPRAGSPGPRASRRRTSRAARIPDPEPGPRARSATTASCSSGWSSRSSSAASSSASRSPSRTGSVPRLIRDGRARRGALDAAAWDARHRRARRDRPRAHPDPVDQSAAARRPRRRAPSPRAAIAAILARRRARARGRRAGARAAARSTPGCAATAPAASRSCCSRTSTSSRRRPSAGPTTRSRADLADGYVYGRGAVDMKAMVAMELAVVAAARGRGARGRPRSRPRPDPRPPPRRPVHLHRRRGGRRRSPAPSGSPSTGPDWLRAAGALNECGGVVDDGRRPALLPDPGRREGLRRLPDPRPRDVGPRLDAARGQRRRPGRRGHRAPRRSRARPALTPVMARFLELAAAELPADAARIARRAVAATTRAAPRPRSRRPATRCTPGRCGRSCATPSARTSSTPGVKYNVIPGDADDRGRLPGPARARPSRTMRAELVDAARAGARRRLRDRAHRLRRAGRGARRRAAVRAAGRARSATTIRTASRCRSWPRSRPTRSTPTPLGTPTYGFSPLRLDPDERFLERFHGVDERVSVEALRWGLPVLYDVVRRFCG